MTVVIHDFEVVAEPKQPGPQQADTASSASKTATPVPTPQDIARIICRHKERHARTRAH
jgi:hypothetical protein